MFNWYKKVVFENYFNFKGRARRSEFWYFVLFNFLIQLPFTLLYLTLFSNENMAAAMMVNGLIMIYSLATLIPLLAVTVRRLHDLGKSGKFIFILFLPVIGVIWLLVLMFMKGEQGENKYGSDPKSIGEEMEEIGQVNSI